MLKNLVEERMKNPNMCSFIIGTLKWIYYEKGLQQFIYYEFQTFTLRKIILGFTG